MPRISLIWDLVACMLCSIANFNVQVWVMQRTFSKNGSEKCSYLKRQKKSWCAFNFWRLRCVLDAFAHTMWRSWTFDLSYQPSRYNRSDHDSYTCNFRCNQLVDCADDANHCPVCKVGMTTLRITIKKRSKSRYHSRSPLFIKIL